MALTGSGEPVQKRPKQTSTKELDMKRSLTFLTLGAIGVLLAGCMDDMAGGGSNPSPSPAPAPAPAPAPQRMLVESRWLGTGPFCDAQPSDCQALGSGWEDIRTDRIGDGAACATGVKVLCERWEWR
jgi:hypothetical protein